MIPDVLGYLVNFNMIPRFLNVRIYHVAYAFRVNLQSEIAWMSRYFLLNIGVISADKMTATGLEPTTSKFVGEQSII